MVSTGCVDCKCKLPLPGLTAAPPLPSPRHPYLSLHLVVFGMPISDQRTSCLVSLVDNDRLAGELFVSAHHRTGPSRSVVLILSSRLSWEWSPTLRVKRPIFMFFPWLRDLYLTSTPQELTLPSHCLYVVYISSIPTRDPICTTPTS